MAKVIIELSNPYDLSASEEQDMLRALAEVAPEAEVHVARRPEEGYGVGLEAIFHVFVENPELATTAFGAIACLVRWLRRRSRDDSRRRTVTIYGPDGEPLKSVRIDASGDTTEEPPPTERRQPPRM